MKRLSIFFWLLVSVTATGCSDRPVDLGPNTDAGVIPSPDAEDPADCSPGKLVCSSVVDLHYCRCEWVCPPGTGTCHNRRPTPKGGGWTCAWVNEYKYTCTAAGSKAQPPDMGHQWYCVWDDKAISWKCVKVVTPVPPGKGSWTCKVNNTRRSLTCTLKNDYPDPDPATWSCKQTGGRMFCQKKGGNGGLPQGGHNWKCNKASKNGVPTWFCYGQTAPGDNAPGQDGWKCVKVKTEPGKVTWRCERADGPADSPPGGGYWACVKGSEYLGTLCEKVPGQPGPPPPYGGKCAPGSRMWCDGLNYSSWGQATCLPGGQWETTVINGKKMLKCLDLATGRRPNTACACYHFYFNPNCCERPDCVVPTGSNGQLCPKSPGKLCDHCNPMKPECTGDGSQCVVTNAHETYCATLCATGADCPSGYKCLTVKLKQGTTKQCIPADYSCYY